MIEVKFFDKTGIGMSSNSGYGKDIETAILDLVGGDETLVTKYAKAYEKKDFSNCKYLLDKI